MTTDLIPEDGGGAAVSSKFDHADRRTIVFLALVMVITSIGFFLYVRWHGLLDFKQDATLQQDRYFLEALELRERRLALVLTYRTFLTTLGFIVGLVLAALGGVFLLRRASMEMKVSGDMAGAQTAKVSLFLNSPGVAFMLGGVGVILVTQLLALPVGAPEIFPRNAQALCSVNQSENGTCTVGNTGAVQMNKIAAFCANRPEREECKALAELNRRLGGKQ